MDKNYKIVLRKEGYFAKTENLSTSGLGTIDTIRKDLSIAKLELNKSYTLQNVLYEFGKSTLTENSKAVLDNLYQILVENPSFIIELSSHTDGIGSDEGNMKLSQARAESCVAYLISKGITKDRLVARGYGKTKPKVPNTTEDGKDDPAGRAINRRTEFQIIGIKKSQ
jgi:outer membrane protein OmpA-like peptidoglycan-associated protein